MARWTLHRSKRAGVSWVDFGARRMVAIVRYHSVSDVRDRNHLYVNRAIAVAPETFERQIEFLAARYRCVRMDDVAEALDGGKPLPANAVAVTFDDGYADNHRHAYPILRRHGVPAMFYLVAGCLDGEAPLWPSEVRSIVHRATARRLDDPLTGATWDLRGPGGREAAIAALKEVLVSLPRGEREAALAELRARCAPEGRAPRVMLTWAEIEEMRAGGMEFGAHTVSHPRLPALPPAEAAAEIRESKTRLEARFRAPVDHFSYPNPSKGLHVDAGVRRLVAGARFRTAVTSLPGYVLAADDRLELKRLVVGARPLDIAWDVERPALGDALWALVAGDGDEAGGRPARLGDLVHDAAAMRIRRLRAAHTAAVAQLGTSAGRALEHIIRADAAAVSAIRATVGNGGSP